jgi:hypothetical protein
VIAQTFAGFAAVGLANAHLYETPATLAGHMQKARESYGVGVSSGRQDGAASTPTLLNCRGRDEPRAHLPIDTGDGCVPRQFLIMRPPPTEQPSRVSPGLSVGKCDGQRASFAAAVWQRFTPFTDAPHASTWSTHRATGSPSERVTPARSRGRGRSPCGYSAIRHAPCGPAHGRGLLLRRR